ncbi:FkbM family methyltransferase [Bosea thiooxidans]
MLKAAWLARLPLGVIESACAIAAFLVAYHFSQSVIVSLNLAIIVAVSALATRLGRRVARLIAGLRECRAQVEGHSAELKKNAADLLTIATDQSAEKEARQALSDHLSEVEPRLEALIREADRLRADAIEGFSQRLASLDAEYRASCAEAVDRLAALESHAAAMAGVANAYKVTRSEQAALAERLSEAEIRLEAMTREIRTRHTELAQEVTQRVTALDAEFRACREHSDGRLADAEQRMVEFDTELREHTAQEDDRFAGLEQRMASLDMELRMSLTKNDDRFAELGDLAATVATVADEHSQTKGEQAELGKRMAKAEQHIGLIERDTDIVRSGVIDVARSGRPSPPFYTAGSFDPEIDVLPTLAQFMESRLAIDVGANRGDFTAALARLGFAVHAFEPLPALHTILAARFSKEPDTVHIHMLACSDVDGAEQLHLAKVDDKTIDPTLFSTLSEHPAFNGLAFENSITVPVRRLDTVFAEAAPLSVGLLKTDTEGKDISVLRGATTIDAAVLMVEFWDKEYVFNAGEIRNNLHDYLEFVDRKKYPFHIIMWRGGGRDEFGITAGGLETQPGSWGNIIFLSDAALVDAILNWARLAYGADRVEIVGNGE